MKYTEAVQIYFKIVRMFIYPLYILKINLLKGTVSTEYKTIYC